MVVFINGKKYGISLQVVEGGFCLASCRIQSGTGTVEISVKGDSKSDVCDQLAKVFGRVVADEDGMQQVSTETEDPHPYHTMD
jgi:hypothetical protein